MKENWYDSTVNSVCSISMWKRLKLALAQFFIDSPQTQNVRFARNGHVSACHNMFSPDGNAIWVQPNSIEVYWTEGKNSNIRYFVRTKSGKDFEINEQSWLQVMYGMDYKKA